LTPLLVVLGLWKWGVDGDLGGCLLI
jgi:hypothetical protein